MESAPKDQNPWRLGERFRENREAYRSREYNEAELVGLV